MLQAFHEAATRQERDDRDRGMPGLLLDVRCRLKQAQADRLELAALKHTSAQHQQQYQHLVSQHELAQESAVVLEARLAAAQAAAAAEASLLQQMVPALVLQCAAILSVEQSLLPAQQAAQQEQQLSAEQMVCLALQGAPVAKGYAYSTTASPVLKTDRHPSSSNGSDRVPMVRTPGQSDKGIHALSKATAAAAAATAATAAAEAEGYVPWGACTSAVASTLTGALAEPLESPTAAAVAAAAAAAAAAGTKSPVPAAAAAETAAAAAALKQVLLAMPEVPHSSSGSSGCNSPSHHSGSSHGSLVAKLFGPWPVPAAAAAGRTDGAPSTPASEVTAAFDGQASADTQSLSDWSSACNAAVPNAAAPVGCAEHLSAASAAADPAVTGWTKRLFDGLLATDSDSSSSSSVGGRKSAVATSPAAAAAALRSAAPFVGPEVAHSYTVYSNPLAVPDGECDWPARTQYRGTLDGSASSDISGSSIRRATASKLAHQQGLEALQKEVNAAALSSQLTRLASRITTRLGQDEFGSFGSSQPTNQQLLAEVLPLLWAMKAMMMEERL